MEDLIIRLKKARAMITYWEGKNNLIARDNWAITAKTLRGRINTEILRLQTFVNLKPSSKAGEAISRIIQKISVSLESDVDDD